jgi:hypothetical protein
MYASVNRARFSLLIPFIAVFILTSASQKPLNNQDLVDMTRAGVDEATIVKTIETKPTAFDTSVQALIALKKAGVSDKVLSAIVSRQQSDREDATSKQPTSLPEEPGVYVKVNDRQGQRFVPLKVEIVTWLTGGVLKSLAFSRGHINGRVTTPLSTLRLSAPLEFIIRCAEGTTGEEYQLLKFWKKDNRREFRLVTGGVIHSSSGADKNVVAVGIEKIGPRTYLVRPSSSLSAGEYRFLPPGIILSASAASSGKIYTFGLDE